MGRRYVAFAVASLQPLLRSSLRLTSVNRVVTIGTLFTLHVVLIVDIVVPIKEAHVVLLATKVVVRPAVASLPFRSRSLSVTRGVVVAVILLRGVECQVVAFVLRIFKMSLVEERSDEQKVVN